MKLVSLCMGSWSMHFSNLNILVNNSSANFHRYIFFIFINISEPLFMQLFLTYNRWVLNISSLHNLTSVFRLTARMYGDLWAMTLFLRLLILVLRGWNTFSTLEILPFHIFFVHHISYLRSKSLKMKICLASDSLFLFQTSPIYKVNIFLMIEVWMLVFTSEFANGF